MDGPKHHYTLWSASTLEIAFKTYVNNDDNYILIELMTSSISVTLELNLVDQLDFPRFLTILIASGGGGGDTTIRMATTTTSTSTYTSTSTTVAAFTGTIPLVFDSQNLPTDVLLG